MLRDAFLPQKVAISSRVQKRQRGPRGNRQRVDFPKEWAGGDKEYLQFVLYKDNLETQVFEPSNPCQISWPVRKQRPPLGVFAISI